MKINKIIFFSMIIFAFSISASSRKNEGRFCQQRTESISPRAFKELLKKNDQTSNPNSQDKPVFSSGLLTTPMKKHRTDSGK